MIESSLSNRGHILMSDGRRWTLFFQFFTLHPWQFWLQLTCNKERQKKRNACTSKCIYNRASLFRKSSYLVYNVHSWSWNSYHKNTVTVSSSLSNKGYRVKYHRNNQSLCSPNRVRKLRVKWKQGCLQNSRNHAQNALQIRSAEIAGFNRIEGFCQISFPRVCPKQQQ